MTDAEIAEIYEEEAQERVDSLLVEMVRVVRDAHATRKIQALRDDVDVLRGVVHAMLSGSAMQKPVDADIWGWQPAPLCTDPLFMSKACCVQGSELK